MPIESTAQITLLYQVAQELSSTLDLEEVLRRVLQVTAQTLGAQRASFFLLDAAGHLVRHIPAYSKTSSSIAAHRAKQVMERGLAGWALRHREAALASDTVTDERWLDLPDDLENIGSALTVPLIYRGRVNGLLTLLHEQRGFFTEIHAALAESIARQAAIAVENARFHTQVRQERTALYSLLSGLPEPTLLVDQQGVVVFANQAAMDIMNDGKIERPLAALFPEEGVQEKFDQAVAAAKSQRAEVTWEDGRIFDTLLAPVADLGVAVCLHDVTRLKQLDAMKSQLVTTVSHDLKNPLTLAGGFAELLLDEEELSANGRRFVQGILSSVEKMRALVLGLLDLAQMEHSLQGEARQTDIGRVVHQVLDALQPRAASKRQTLAAELPSRLPPVQIDPLRLAQVVENLLDNALKYTQEGGHIRVTADVDSGSVRVVVEDNGPGIPQVAQSRLFERFYRVDGMTTSREEGTGLGLSIVRAIVESCDGEVGLESEEGRGSRFWFSLPVSASPEPVS